VAALEDRCYTTKEVAAFVGRSVPTIKRWKREGRFPKAAINKGRYVVWYGRQVNEWLSEQGAE
jgi:predicted DNA-binding transcriptional regulator AlpA